jgi:hypothetical protein
MGAVAAPGFQSPGLMRRMIAGRKAFRRLSVAVATGSPFVNSSATPNSFAIAVLSILLLLSAVPSLHGREHKRKIKTQDYGLGFSTEISSPENEVVEAVEAIVNDGIIQGSKEYNKDKYVENASAATASPLFPEWKEPGKVYYKIRTSVLAPLNFKDSKDEGTLGVRYVVQSKDASKTILRIDAIFVEDFHRTVHASDGSVEAAECQDIQDHIDAVDAEKKQTDEREKQRAQKLEGQMLEPKRHADEASALAVAQTSARTLNQHLDDLRRRAERVVKAPGGRLKFAPFHSASNVKSLEAGAEVVILVVTPYWYGVETTDGQHGWINREQLEPLP